MSRKKTALIKNIRDFEKQRQQTLSELFDLDDLVRGSLATVYTKCGKDNCRCKNGKGHPHARISWSEKGQGFTRKVPKDEIIWCQEKTENYRKFRSLKSKLKDVKVILAGYPKEQIDEHKKSGVDDFIFLGADVYEINKMLLNSL